MRQHLPRDTGNAGRRARLGSRLRADTWGRVTELAWPAIVTGAIRVSMRTVDILVVGRVVGTAAVAGLGIADAAARLVTKLAQGLAAGTVALVSQNTGAGRRQAADTAMAQSVVLSLVLGTLLAAAGFALAPVLFEVIGADDDVRRAGTAYLRIVLASAPLRMLALMATKGLQAATDTRTPMVVRGVATAVNIGLTVVLVPGLAGAPRLGIEGAAIATALGNTLAGLGFVGVLASGRFAVGLRRARWAAPDTLVAITRIGAPQVVERVLFAAGELPLNAIVLSFGTPVNAAFQIGRRVQHYVRMPARGFAAAASALVGTRLGAARPERSDHYGRGALSLAAIVAVVMAATASALAAPLAGAFVTDETTVALAATWIYVFAVATVFRSVFAVLRGALQAAGDTLSPMYATVLGLVLFRLGFSYVVGVVLAGALWGVYAGVALDYLARSAFAGHRYRRGRWKRVGADGAPTDRRSERSAPRR